MDTTKTSLIKSVVKVTKLIETHAVFAFILLFSALAAYLIVQSSTIIGKEPSDLQITEAQAAVRSIEIDEQSLRVINELNSRNISLDSLFIDRENPFEQ